MEGCMLMPVIDVYALGMFGFILLMTLLVILMLVQLGLETRHRHDPYEHELRPKSKTEILEVIEEVKKERESKLSPCAETRVMRKRHHGEIDV